MHIALVTTWLQPCGIATYSENLAAALIRRGHEVTILAEHTHDERTDAPEGAMMAPVVRCWNRADPIHRGIPAVLQAVRPDVIHVQHEFGLFPDRAAFLRLVQSCSTAAPTYLTPHTIVDAAHSDALALFRSPWSILRQRRVRLVCHTREGADALVRDFRYPADLIRVIAHGCIDPREVERVDRHTARARLGLPQDGVVLLSLGFIGAGKKQDRVLDALGELVTEGAIDPAAVYYVVAGKAGGGWSGSGEYVDALRRAVVFLNLSGVCEIREGFVDADELPAWFGAADVVVNCSTWTAHGATGRCRLACTYGVAQIAEAVDLHRDILDAGAAEPFALDDLDGLKSAIVRLVRSPQRRALLAEAGEDFARATSWGRVAEAHLAWWGVR